MSSSSKGSATADSIDVAESCDTLRLALLEERLLLFPPVKSLASRIIAKYVSGGRLLAAIGTPETV
jgi:hypothetical protein